MKEDTNSKMASRKFIVWLAATVYMAITLALGFFTKDTSLAEQFIPWWGGISMLYIGGNVAQKFAKPGVSMQETETNEE